MIRTHRNLLIVFLLALIPSFAEAQADSTNIPPKRRNAVYLELGGSSGLYSLNYERTVPINDLAQFNFGIGGSVYAFSIWTTTLVTGAPVSASIALGRKKHKFEAGIGAAFLWLDVEDFLYTPNVNMGYRFEGDNGFLLKAGIMGTLIVDPDPNATYVDPYVWPKLGFGYRF